MNEHKLSKVQENKLSTFIDIETVLDRNSSIVTEIPALSVSVLDFKKVISDINSKAVRRNTVRRGASETKTLKRIELENTTVELASALYVFGHKNSDEVIKAIANIPPSLLDRMRDTEVINKANSILNTVTEKADDLTSFGITQTDIARLRSCIENYISSNINKSGSHTESVVITKTLKELFQTGMDILDKEIDRMVDSLQTKEKNFYESYYAVRSVKNFGLRHRKETDLQPQKQD
ncbi:MAG: hypothetical protein IPM96_04385 [Ignavibacteria bacterium]|nr:hypothetical protein [Ignavibacteria bacterium]